MRKYSTPGLVFSLLALAGLLLSTTPATAGSVVASKHNLSFAGTTTQVCVYCHTPHQPEDFGGSQITTDPLWNHELSANAAYGVYDSPTFDAGPGNLNTISDIGGGSEISNLCMSCHDATVGLSSLYKEPTDGTSGVLPTMDLFNPRANLGTDLSNDHPVNFLYNAALVAADGALVSPDSASSVDATGNIRLFAGSVQCASCHNPHDPDNLPFLAVSNNASALCTSCHLK